VVKRDEESAVARLTCPLNAWPLKRDCQASEEDAERVAAKHPATLDKRFIHPKPEQKED